MASKTRKDTEGFSPDQDETGNDAKPSLPFAIPEGFEVKTSDLVGIWDLQDGDSGEFYPLFASASDSSLDERKPSVLITCKAVTDIECKDRDENPVTVHRGEQFGIWYKPGMRPIIDCADAHTFMGRFGTIDVGKPSAMIQYYVAARKGSMSKAIELRFDWRKQSRNAPLPGAFAIPAKNARVASPGTSVPGGFDDDDRMPF